MNKLQLGITGLVISALLTSNVIVTCQARTDQTEFQNEISKQKQLLKSEVVKNKKTNEKVKKLLQTIDNQSKSIDNQTKSIQEKSSEIYNLKQQLQKATTRNELPHRQLNMNITAYISNCSGCSGFTFTEHDVRNTVYYQGYRVVAADTNVIPLYSIIEIKTQNRTMKGIVIDKGGLIRGHILDLLVGSYSEAVEFGRQNATVTILREGKG